MLRHLHKPAASMHVSSKASKSTNIPHSQRHCRWGLSQPRRGSASGCSPLGPRLASMLALHKLKGGDASHRPGSTWTRHMSSKSVDWDACDSPLPLSHIIIRATVLPRVDCTNGGANSLGNFTPQAASHSWWPNRSLELAAQNECVLQHVVP
jgi:hypothetical protein